MFDKPVNKRFVLLSWRWAEDVFKKVTGTITHQHLVLELFFYQGLREDTCNKNCESDI